MRQPSCCAGCIRVTRNSPLPAKRWTIASRRLVLTAPETIEARTDPWDPHSAPSRLDTETARDAEKASEYLAQGQAELDAMLGMQTAKREIKRIRSTTKVNLARTKVGLRVPLTSRHTLLLGPPGTGKTSVARSFTKQLCGLKVLRKPLVVETSRAKLLGRYMADAEKNTEEMLEGALGGAVFFDEMHTLHERGYSTGDPYGNAIINTLLLYMENHRDELVVFGAGYAKATERMLEVNQGLRRRFSTVIEFHSYTPPELIELTRLMVSEDEDVTTDEAVEVLRPDFERFYADQSCTAEGDLIRGIDVLGNAGFVRNVVEKARDHRNDRLDTAELDELLASDEVEVSEEQLLRLRELTREDLAEGLTRSSVGKAVFDHRCLILMGGPQLVGERSPCGCCQLPPARLDRQHCRGGADERPRQTCTRAFCLVRQLAAIWVTFRRSRSRQGRLPAAEQSCTSA